MKIDNFALSIHQVCPSKFKLRIEDHWTSRRRSGALGFGAAIHAGLAEWHRGHGLAAALNGIGCAWEQEPVDDYRTLQKAIEVMTAYARHYPTENWTVVGMPDQPVIEKAFTLDTGMVVRMCAGCGADVRATMPDVVSTLTPDRSNGDAGISGYPDDDRAPDGRINDPMDAIYTTCPVCSAPLEPIEYGGIFDGLIDFNGVLYNLEHKSTSQLGDYYFEQFKPNNQVTGYVWAAEKLSGRRVSGALVNAIGVYKSSPTRFARQPTSRNRRDIAEWLRNVRAVCEEITWNRRVGFWPMRTAACTLYGQCEFRKVHVLSNPREREIVLEQDYVKHEWDFERRD